MNETPGATLSRLIVGFQVSQAIHVAAVLGVADLLADGPKTSDELATETDSHAGALYRLLRALASVGVFHEDEGKRFSLTPSAIFDRAMQVLTGAANRALIEAYDFGRFGTVVDVGAVTARCWRRSSPSIRR